MNTPHALTFMIAVAVRPCESFKTPMKRAATTVNAVLHLRKRAPEVAVAHKVLMEKPLLNLEKSAARWRLKMPPIRSRID